MTGQGCKNIFDSVTLKRPPSLFCVLALLCVRLKWEDFVFVFCFLRSCLSLMLFLVRRWSVFLNAIWLFFSPQFWIPISHTCAIKGPYILSPRVLKELSISSLFCVQLYSSANLSFNPLFTCQKKRERERASCLNVITPILTCMCV